MAGLTAGQPRYGGQPGAPVKSAANERESKKDFKFQISNLKSCFDSRSFALVRGLILLLLALFLRPVCSHSLPCPPESQRIGGPLVGAGPTFRDIRSLSDAHPCDQGGDAAPASFVFDAG